VKVFKNLSILLDCGLPDVEFGVFSNLKIQYFGSENESLNKHLFITFLNKIHQLVNLINSPWGGEKKNLWLLQTLSTSKCPTVIASFNLHKGYFYEQYDSNLQDFNRIKKEQAMSTFQNVSAPACECMCFFVQLNTT